MSCTFLCFNNLSFTTAIMAKGSLIRKYFEFDTNSNQSICQVTEEQVGLEESNVVELSPCRTVVRVSNTSSMIRHVRKRHPEIYKQYQEDRKELARKRLEERRARRSAASYANEKEQDDIINACVELVTVNEKPFAVIKDSGFRRLLELGNANVVLNEAKIADSVLNKAEAIRAKIIKSVSSRVISIKIDCITNSGRSFMGIHVPLYVDGKIRIYTLSVVEVKSSYTCEKLKKIVLQELDKFNINVDNVYSITIDSAGNLLKSKSITSSLDNDCSLKDEFENSTLNVEDLTTFDHSDYQSTDILINKLCKNTNTTVEASDDTNTADITIGGEKCRTLIFHEIISNTLEEENSEIVNHARSVVKEFKNPNVISSLRRSNLKEPILDYPNSWITTYDMLQRLFELKDICNKLAVKHKSLSILQDDWNKIKDIVDALKPCKKAALLLQEESVTLTDLYKILSIYAMEISVVGSEFSKLLMFRIKAEIEILFSSPTFVSAMFMDPRFSATLECKYANEAMKHLTIIYNKITGLEAMFKDDNVQEEPTTTEEDEFEQLLCRYEEKLNEGKRLQRSNHIERCLKEFNFRPRLHSKESVIKFWESNKSDFRELYKLASVFLQVPATQISAHRTFSEIMFMLNPTRSKMSKSMLNEIILVRTNFYDE